MHPFFLHHLIALLTIFSVLIAHPQEPLDALSQLEEAIQENPLPLAVETAVESGPRTQAWTDTTWYLRRYTLKEETSPLQRVPTTSEVTAPRWIELPLDYADARDFYMPIDKPLFGWDQLTVRVRLPKDLPADTIFYFFVKDWDDLWLHIEREAGVEHEDGSVTFTLPLRGQQARDEWTPRGHDRPWHQLWPGRLREFGIKLSPPEGVANAYEGNAYLTDITLTRLPAEARPAPRLLDIRRTTGEPQAGKLVEYAFSLTHELRQPFDRRDTDLVATILTPRQELVTSRLFYREDFTYDEQTYAGHLVIPKGPPEFVLRYRPRWTGAYEVRIGGAIGSKTVELPPITFNAAPAAADWQGFIERAPADNRLLVYGETGREFAGLGMNVRSPYDTRYVASFPFTGWDHTDFEIYESLMRKYAANGINVMEVWMSPWWLALEWMPDAPGNHGVGHMNQWRSWRLDRLLQLAEDLGIYVILVINNHGKFSAWIDSDWGRNPYNIKQGGFLETPMEYFSDARAKQAFRRLADYMVARWGHSPHLLAWKLFTEIDLTGNNREWYKDPSVTAWHKFAADYFHDIDPNRHLVTTHWATSYKMVNQELAQLEALDILTLDIYYGGSGSKHLFDYMFATSDFVERMGKPAIITEFGGSPHGDTLPYILKQLHMALWLGYFTRFPVSPCFWWFPLVEEKDLYHEYAALSRFMAGESRLGAASHHSRLDEDLYLCELRQPDRRLFYLLDTTHYFANSLTEPTRRFQDRQLPVHDLSNGKWRVEYWNPQTGKRIGPAQVLHVTDSETRLTLPAFSHGLAMKLMLESTPPNDQGPAQ